VFCSFTVDTDPATSADGFVNEFGGADAGDECEGLDREFRVESHAVLGCSYRYAIMRLFALDRMGCSCAVMDVATSGRSLNCNWLLAIQKFTEDVD